MVCLPCSCFVNKIAPKVVSKIMTKTSRPMPWIGRASKAGKVTKQNKESSLAQYRFDLLHLPPRQNHAITSDMPIIGADFLSQAGLSSCTNNKANNRSKQAYLPGHTYLEMLCQIRCGQLVEAGII